MPVYDTISSRRIREVYASCPARLLAFSARPEQPASNLSPTPSISLIERTKQEDENNTFIPTHRIKLGQQGIGEIRGRVGDDDVVHKTSAAADQRDVGDKVEIGRVRIVDASGACYEAGARRSWNGRTLLRVSELVSHRPATT